MGIASITPQTTPPKPHSDARQDFLLETVACDINLCAIEVGAIATFLVEFIDGGPAHTLMGCRRMLVDDSKILLLALKYGTEFGLSPKLVDMLVRLCMDIAAAKARLLRVVGLPNVDVRVVRTCHTEWQALARSTADCVRALSKDVATRLDPVYGEDARLLIDFLGKCGSATRAADPSNPIRLPRLKQQRRSARLTLGETCKILIDGKSIAAQASDISTSGMGVSCDQSIPLGQRVVVQLRNGRRLEGSVIRSNFRSVGLRFAQPLSPIDPIFLQG